MKYNVYESLGVDKGAIIALEVRLNRILNEFSKKYNKCFYTKYDEYEMRDVLWCNTTIICALDTNEHFTDCFTRYSDTCSTLYAGDHAAYDS